MKILFCIVSLVSAASASLYWLLAPHDWTDVEDVLAAGQSAELGKEKAAAQGIACIGYIEPVTQVRALAFDAIGAIESCSVTVGQSVKKSEALMALEASEAKQSLGVAERELELARARQNLLLSGVHPQEIAAAGYRLAAIERRLDRLRAEFDRSQKLVVNRATSISTHEEIVSDLEVAEQEHGDAQAKLFALKENVRDVDKAVAQAEVAVAQSRVDQARQRVEQSILRAPFDGVVLEILKHAGESNFSERQEPVMLFADLSRLQVRAEIDELHVHELHDGQRALVFGKNLGNMQHEGNLGLVKQIMGPKTVFTHDSTERRDLNVLQVLIEMPAEFSLPVGLRVDVLIMP